MHLLRLLHPTQTYHYKLDEKNNQSSLNFIPAYIMSEMCADIISLLICYLFNNSIFADSVFKAGSNYFYIYLLLLRSTNASLFILFQYLKKNKKSNICKNIYKNLYGKTPYYIIRVQCLQSWSKI